MKGSCLSSRHLLREVSDLPKFRSRRTVYVGGGLALASVYLVGLLGQQQIGRSSLVQESILLKDQRLARQLVLNGNQRKEQAEREIHLGEQLWGGVQILAGSWSADPNCTGSTLECAGVKLDGSAFDSEIKLLPGWKAQEDDLTDQNTTNDAEGDAEDGDEEYDWYNRKARKKLIGLGINVGTMFWEPEDIDAPPKNRSALPSPEEESSEEELNKLLQQMEEQRLSSSPEQRLVSAGIKVSRMPWDPEPVWKDYYFDDYSDKEEENAEDEDADAEEDEDADADAAEKGRPLLLKMVKDVKEAERLLGYKKGMHPLRGGKPLHMLRGGHPLRRGRPKHAHDSKFEVFKLKVNDAAYTRELQEHEAYMKARAAYENYREQLRRDKLRRLGIN